MNTTVKIVRVLWANIGSTDVFSQIPKIPTVQNQVVYVWGDDVNSYVKSLGYETRLIQDDRFKEENNTEYGRKLVALDLALKEFGEVLLLDWDCYILRPFDDNFYNYLREKPIQCPLYAQHKETSKALKEVFTAIGSFNEVLETYAKTMETEFTKYSWGLDNGLVTPNFGCVYSRDINFASDLIDIATKYNLIGCVEEHAMWIYSNCSLLEYINKYQPLFVQGVSDDRTDHEFMISKVQRKLNKFISDQIPMDIYLKHI